MLLVSIRQYTESGVTDQLGFSVPLTRVHSVDLAVCPRTLTCVSFEPAFLITKPFEPETLDVAISQALAAYRG